MSAEETRLKVLLIEDDPPVMRLMAWSLEQEDNGFDVQVVSKREALQIHGLEGCDVAVFNMQATSADKTNYVRQLRMLNPDCIIIDVDEFAGNGDSVRDSGSDSYTTRPVRVDALVKIIREMTQKTLQDRRQLLADAERELHGGQANPGASHARDSEAGDSPA